MTIKHTAAASDIRVFFRSFRDDNWNVYFADGDLVGQRAVQSELTSELRPRARLGGGNVLFSSNRTGASQLYRQDFDGTDLTQLTVTGTNIHGDWSPDGKKIVYANNDTGSWNVYTMNLDGSNVRCISCGEPASNVAPSWSPDGRRIAWLMVNTSSGQSSLKVMDADGANKATLINNVYYADMPRWAPDGVHIALDYAPAEGQWNRVAVVNAMNGAVREVYNPNQALVDGSMGSWSPDGQSIYFTRWEYVNQNGQLLIQASYIGRVSWLGGAPQLLTATGRDATPDAKSIDKIPPTSSLSLPAWSQAQLQTVRIAGSDTGSGIDHYDVQAKVGSAGAWTDWKPGLTSNETYLSGQPGQVVSLRVRAHDYAGNVEEWPASDAADATTSLYAHVFTARTLDNRGQPVPNAAITSTHALGPVVYQPGRAASEIISTAAQSHTLRFGKPGYGSVGPQYLPLGPVYQRLLHVFPPLTSTVTDGEFESGALDPAWTAQPPSSAVVRELSKHTGQYGMALGAIPAFRAVTLTLVPDTALVLSRLFVDRVRGNGFFAQHVDSRLLFYRRAPSDPSRLTAIATGITGNGMSFSSASFTQSPSGYHALTILESQVQYCFLPNETLLCTSPQFVANIDRLNDVGSIMQSQSFIWITGDGSVTAAWLMQHSNGSNILDVDLQTRTRGADGVWGATNTFSDIPVQQFTYQVALDESGSLHLVWVSDTFLRHMRLFANGQQSPQVNLDGPFTPQLPVPVVAMDSDASLHIFLYGTDETNAKHFVRSKLGTWTVTNSQPVSWAQQDAGNRLHVLQRGNATLSYAVITPDGQSTEIARIPFNPYLYSGGPFVAGIDNAGTMSVWLVDRIVSTQPIVAIEDTAPSAANSSIRRQFSIGGNLRNPTLSFVYRALVNSGASALRVSIDNGGTPVPQAMPLASNGTWQHGWIDMSPWAGQTVTVTFQANQATPAFPIDIDELSLGEWTTPVINQVSPQKLAANAPATTLTLTGANFAATPTLSINGVITLTDVIYGNAGLITATLPAGLPVGRHDIWLTNPDGQQTVKAGALQVGERVALPLAFR